MTEKTNRQQPIIRRVTPMMNVNKNRYHRGDHLNLLIVIMTE